MSEKATLLTSIPPVAKSEPVKKSSLLSSVQEVKGTSAKAPQAAVKSSASDSVKASSVVAKNEVTGKTGAAKQVAATETVAGEGVSEVGATITAFQGVTYASLVIAFCLAGFAAVVLFRKATKVAEARFILSAKVLAGAFGFIALHGVFTTFLYTNYLRAPNVGVPLVMSMSLWVVVGVAVGIILNYLLAPEKQPKRKDLFFDAAAYALIFGCAMIGVATGIKTNAALLFSLAAGFLFIVPVARFATAFKTAKARHPELRETADQVLIHVLLYLPGLLPIIAFLEVIHVFSADMALFLFNFIAFDFVLVAGLAMLASANEVSLNQAEGSEVETKSDALAEGHEEDVAEVIAPVAPVASTGSMAEIDPIIEFLNSQDEAAKLEAAEMTTPASEKPMVAPRKPTKPNAVASRPTPPKKPSARSTHSDTSAAPNAPSRVKAPMKPKKRF